MTDAISLHGLSKLDLFTPNRLHPTLPPLTLGIYKCMGSDTIMLSTPSVLARKDHIHDLLRDKAKDAGFLRRRIAALERAAMHMGVECFAVQKQGKVLWVKKRSPEVHRYHEGESKSVPKRVPKSMETKEAREAYVRKELAKQWDAMGMGEMGASKEEAIEIE
jgi:hypothetical protein